MIKTIAFFGLLGATGVLALVLPKLVLQAVSGPPSPKSATIVLQELQQTRVLVAAIAFVAIDQPVVQKQIVSVPLLGQHSIGERTVNLRTSVKVPLQYNLGNASVKDGAIAFPCLEAGLSELGEQDARYNSSWFAPGSDAEINTEAQNEALRTAKAKALTSGPWRQKAQDSAVAFVQTFENLEVTFKEDCDAN